MAAKAFLVFLFGTVVGSFLNCCIYRIPRGESIVLPPSRCPQCLNRLGALDLIPVLSCLALRGRCRYCGGAISSRYPLVELLSGTAFASEYLVRGWGPGTLLPLVLTSILIVVAFIDAEAYVIPNSILVFGFAAFVAVSALIGPLNLWETVLGLSAGSLPLLVLFLLTGGRGMGFGDVKLGALIGVYVGWQTALVSLFVAFAFGGSAAIVLMASGKRSRKDRIAFGPFLAAGAFTALLWAERIINWYATIML